MKKLYPGDENSFDKSAKPINIPKQMDNKDYGKKSKVVPRKVQLKSSGNDHKFYGSRTIMTKESTYTKWAVTYDVHGSNREVPLYTATRTVRAASADEAIATVKKLLGGRNHKANLVEQEAKPTLIDFLITENEDLSALPDKVMGEIKSNIRKGAKDLQQQWKDALELVHKAYEVTLVRRPVPDQKGAWKQYMDLIGYGVQQLRHTRGIDGKWRRSQALVREAITEGENLKGRRYFVEVPGNAPQEVEADNMDDIIEKMQNKLRSQGAKLRIERRDKYVAVVTVWVDGEMRERIIVKEL